MAVKEVSIKGLVIKDNKTNVSIYEDKNKHEFDLRILFTEEEFKCFVRHLEILSSQVWKTLNIKEADNYGSDYFEYYDRVLDSNGYLRLAKTKQGIEVKLERPTRNEDKVYQFNKQKMGTFLFDCYELINKK